MAALLRYFAGIAVILPVVMALFAVNMGEIFVGIAAIAQPPVTETPRWNIKRLRAEPNAAYIVLGSLSPIYPATPGKELLGRPVSTASVKSINIRQPLSLHKLPRQLYAEREQDRDYPQHALGYAAQPSPPRTRIIFGHGIY